MSISTRLLRRYTGDGDVILHPPDSSSDDDTPFSDGVKNKKLSANRYDLLNQQSNSDSECKDEKEDNNDGSDRKSDMENSNERRFKEQGKKKKKKKKKSCKPVVKQNHDDIDDEVERSVKEVNAILGETVFNSHKATKSEEAVCKNKILSIEPRHLLPKNELKRIFGANIVASESGNRKNQGRRTLKNFLLVQAKPHWPPPNKYECLTMRLLKTKDGIQYFTFEQSSAYQEIKKECIEAVKSMNPANVMIILSRAPYHVDTLIQAADIFKTNEDFPMAAELIEKALYSMEYAFHPSFSLTKGNCRLDYDREENRGLFIALFKHMLSVGQKACHRTALELCKVIFNLQPEKDPLAIMLAIDFYALRAREFDWFVKFVEEWDAEKNLSQLPNIAYSKALALFQLSDPRADEVLQDALLMFPSLLIHLLRQCQVEPDSETLSHPFFGIPNTGRNGGLHLLIDLYVRRCFHVWKDRDTINWLEKNSHCVLERVKNKDPIVAENAKKRARRFGATTPREIERHAMLSDINLPFVVLARNYHVENTYAFDPFPPIDTLYTTSENQSDRTAALNTSVFHQEFTDGRGRLSVEFTAINSDRLRALVSAMRNLPLLMSGNGEHDDEEDENHDGNGGERRDGEGERRREREQQERNENEVHRSGHNATEEDSEEEPNIVL